MDKKSCEMYLKAIYCLEEESKSPKTVNISKFLKVKPASVTEMLSKLSQQGYILYTPYKAVQLTKKGTHLAKKVVRKQRLLESFLYDVLKVNASEVKSQACEMEHTLDDKTDEKLCISLNRPMKDPIENRAIPHCTKKIKCKDCLTANSDLKRML